MPRHRSAALKVFFLIGRIALVAALAVYLLILGHIYVNQQNMLYEKVTTVTAPKVDGVPDIEDIRLKTPDGETLRAWYLPPEDGKPLILFFGGQGSGIHDQSDRYIRMHREGVGFLALSYRGYAGSTGTPSETGLFTDAATAYDWLAAQGYGPERIVLHGHSLGSGVATWLATQRPARALILEAPFTAASDVGQERYPLLPVSFLMKDKYLSRDRIKDVHIPVLIAHGDRDTVIPFHHGVRLYDLANQPKTFARYEGSDHSTLVRDGLYERSIWPFLGLK
ncbi:alpha/beta hydrolase [Asticcacaulis endophyticus]|uniref:Alpha/beta hydrolase n=1 Tax=Asticcacaulis endophyticus TaxID=1395890 RepID=A0A918PS17_9CAUL|nr:alpha/beta fold hydrolase [Asticcacaulis endophyticus]GGZ20078.1 alpha/beta hydrolase [Asticcacaulis endophyticus]